MFVIVLIWIWSFLYFVVFCIYRKGKQAMPFPRPATFLLMYSNSVQQHKILPRGSIVLSVVPRVSHHIVASPHPRHPTRWRHTSFKYSLKIWGRLIKNAFKRDHWLCQSSKTLQMISFLVKPTINVLNSFSIILPFM